MPAGRRVCGFLHPRRAWMRFPLQRRASDHGQCASLAMREQASRGKRWRFAMRFVTIPNERACGVAKRFRCGRNPQCGK